DAGGAGAGAGEVEAAARADVAEPFEEHANPAQVLALASIEAAHGGGHAVSGDHVGHGEGAAIEGARLRDGRLDPLVEQSDRALEPVRSEVQVAADDPFLGVADPEPLTTGDDLRDLIHVEVPAGAVAGAEVGGDGPVPSLEHVALARVGGVERDPGLRAADRRPGERELELHGLGEVDNLAGVEGEAHAGAAAGRAAAERVDDEPAAGAGLGVGPADRARRGAPEEGAVSLPHGLGGVAGAAPRY